MWTYARAGVDIKKEAAVVRALREGLRKVSSDLSVVGHFAGLIELPFDSEHLLALTCDGVGSKTLIAQKLGKFDTIGIDCIAMNVNDIICVGAKPLAFVDYLAVQQLDEEVAKEIAEGLQKGAELAGVRILGGETATLPELINGIDLSGACVGYVRRDAVVSGEKIEKGDVIIGLESSGIHSNGLTLARKVIESAGLSYEADFPYGAKTIGEELLTPTRIYVKEVLELLRTCEVHGLAHITGGGLLKLLRLTKLAGKDLGFELSEPLEPQPIFTFLQELGGIKDAEMYKTFNMGMGFAVVVPESEEHKARRIAGGRVVGRVIKGREVRIKDVRIR